MAIRPEGADPMSRPVSGIGSQPQPSASPQMVATRQPPPAKPVSAPARNGGGPLSLEPQGQSADAAPSAPRERAAAAAPTAAPRLASVSSTAAGGSAAGGYVVQISSQRSEADAQASFRSLQSKFPNELGDREAIVRRADLGEKGVYSPRHGGTVRIRGRCRPILPWPQGGRRPVHRPEELRLAARARRRLARSDVAGPLDLPVRARNRAHRADDVQRGRGFHF